MLPSMMTAEEQLATSGENGTDEGLSAAAVTAVKGGERRPLDGRRGHGAVLLPGTLTSTLNRRGAFPPLGG